MLTNSASESAIDKLLPDDGHEARLRMRRGRTGSEFVDEMLKNADLSDLAEDAPPQEILEKAVQTAVNTEVDARVKDMTVKMNVKEALGEMHEKEIYHLKAELRRTEARYTLELENIKKDHKNEIEELRKKNLEEGLPQLRALRVDYEEQKKAYEASISEMHQQSSKEFLALKEEKRELELEITRLKEQSDNGNGASTKKMIVVTNSEKSEELESEIVRQKSEIGRLRAMSECFEIEASKTVRELESQSEQTRTELMRMKRDKDSESQETVMIRMKLTQLEEQMKKNKEEEKRLKSEFSKSIASLEAKNEDLRLELGETREREDALNAELDIVRDQMAMLEWRQEGRNENEREFPIQDSFSPHGSQPSEGSDGAYPPNGLVFIPKNQGRYSPHGSYSPINQSPKTESDEFPEEEAGSPQLTGPTSAQAEPLKIAVTQYDSIFPSIWPQFPPSLSLSNMYRLSIVDKDRASKPQNIDKSQNNSLTLEKFSRIKTEFEKINAENNILKKEILRLEEEIERLKKQSQVEQNRSSSPKGNLNDDKSNPQAQDEINVRHAEEIKKLNERIQSLDITHQRAIQDFEVKFAEGTAELKEKKSLSEELQIECKILTQKITEIVADRDLRLSASTRLVISLSNEIDKLREMFS